MDKKGTEMTEEATAEKQIQDPAAFSKSVDQEVIEVEKKIAQQLSHGRKVKIRIPSESRWAGGTAPVSVGVNGRGYLIKRDEDVIVPEGVYNVLMEAKQGIYETYDEYGQKKSRFREVLRFPIIFNGYVDQEAST
ncbi:MAG: hypothetical protein IJU76_08360 [Desulfovibrionaceae bacterium]|nr:hypothetical protein [Desulfovibrionaceae bacterium]